MELIKNNKLIEEEEWIKKIETLKPLKDVSDSEKNIIVKVRKLLEEAILSKINIIKEPIGIFFSGGLDSSLITAICKKYNAKFTCYTVGFQDGNMKEPEDIKYAIKVAKYLKLNDENFKIKIFNLKEINEILLKTAKIIKDIPENPNINPNVNLGVAAVEVAAYSISKKENYFFSGIGSEELFAGYERHKKNPTNEECYNGLIKMYQRDLLRDYFVSKSLKFQFLTPFLDDKLIRYSLAVPIKYKINNIKNKIILHKTATHYLGKYAERPKKAAQYGSSFDKAITKLAIKNGFKTKKEYYNSIIINQEIEI